MLIYWDAFFAVLGAGTALAVLTVLFWALAVFIVWLND